MFEYRMVMSIHDQKMQEYRAQAELDRMARMSGQRPVARVVRFVAQRVRATGRALGLSRLKTARLA